MTWSTGGAPHSVLSPAVCASDPTVGEDALQVRVLEGVTVVLDDQGFLLLRAEILEFVDERPLPRAGGQVLCLVPDPHHGDARLPRPPHESGDGPHRPCPRG